MKPGLVYFLFVPVVLLCSRYVCEIIKYLTLKSIDQNYPWQTRLIKPHALEERKLSTYLRVSAISHSTRYQVKTVCRKDTLIHFKLKYFK